MMKKLYAVGFVLVALALTVVPGSRVWAGATSPASTVFISETGGSGFAYGNLGGVRNSASTIENIGCVSYFSSFDGRPLIGCSATNAAGLSRSCWYTTGNQAGVIALTDDSLLYFYWDASGTCIDVRVVNSNKYESKKL
jgi:hypothetical protein